METKANYVLVGVFTLVAIVAAFGFVYWTATVSDHGETAQLRVVIPGSASGLAAGSTVLFNGVPIGTVKRVWLPYDDPTIAIADTEIVRLTPITKSTTDSTYAVSYFPKDDRILFTRDQGGNELNHLYVLKDGQERDLTPGEKLKAQFAGWTPDGGAFFVASNERDPRYFDIYRYDAGTYQRTLVYKNEHGDFPDDISGDGKWVAMTKLNSTNDSDIYLWNAETRALTHLTPHKGEAQYSPATFDPPSRYLYYLSNEGGEFTRLRRYSLAAGTHEDVEKADWDVAFTSFSHNGRYRVTGVNKDGRAVITVVETASGKPVALPAIPNGGVGGVSIARSESKLAFYVNGDRSPNDLHVLQLGTNSAPAKLTSSLSPDIDPADLVDTQVVRFKARDGVTIPNILWKPHQATPAAKAPALVFVHGGPGGQTTSGYSAIVQYYVNHGYVILGINFSFEGAFLGDYDKTMAAFINGTWDVKEPNPIYGGTGTWTANWISFVDAGTSDASSGDASSGDAPQGDVGEGGQ